MFRTRTAFFVAIKLFLFAVPCLFALSSCAQKEPAPAEERQEKPEHAPSQTPGASEASGDTPGDAPAPAQPPAAADAPDRDAFGTDPSLFPRVLADTEDLLFVLKECGYDPDQGYHWTAEIENRSAHSLLFSLDQVSHDGVMCDPYWAQTAAPGRKETFTISWLPYTLEEAGLTDITQTECVLTVFNDDDYTAPALLRQECRVFPRGEDAARIQVWEPQEKDRVLLSNDRCRITLTGIETEGEWGFTARLYLENFSDQNLIFSAENVTVNGIMADPAWAAPVAAGKRSASSVIWSLPALREKGIEQVEEISLPFRIYNERDYSDTAAQETVSVTL